MSEDERREVVASLPSDLPLSAGAPPEGDTHFEEVVRTRDVLRGYFRRTGRRVYIANNLGVYYPGERLFAPDLLAVVDVELHPRDSWVVDVEGKGLDLALEVLWSGRRAKDLRDNVVRYASLGIPEYFVFDRRRLRIEGYRLPSAHAREYQRIVPQTGRYASRVLALELGIEGHKLRFFHAEAPLPESAELISRLDASLTEAIARSEASEQRAEEETRRAQEETRRAEDLERRLAEAVAELERLRGK